MTNHPQGAPASLTSAASYSMTSSTTLREAITGLLPFIEAARLAEEARASAGELQRMPVRSAIRKAYEAIALASELEAPSPVPEPVQSDDRLRDLLSDAYSAGYREGCEDSEQPVDGDSLADGIQDYLSNCAALSSPIGKDMVLGDEWAREAKSLIPALLGHADYDHDVSDNMRTNLRAAARLPQATPSHHAQATLGQADVSHAISVAREMDAEDGGYPAKPESDAIDQIGAEGRS